MSKQRTASEIRAMLDRIAETNSVNTYLGRFLAHDIPRLLDAAVKLRAVAFDAWEWGWMGNAREVLAETAWLADSPEPADSPDGENEEES